MSLFFRVPPHIVDRRRRRRIPVRPKTAKITMTFPGQKTLAEALHANGQYALSSFLSSFAYKVPSPPIQ